jgi:putative membrane protein
MSRRYIFSRVARDVGAGLYAQERERRRAEAARTFTRGNLPRLLGNALLIILGVIAAAALFDGITYGGHWPTLFLVAVVLSLLNSLLKPLLIVFALPFVLMTLGLGIAVINALLLMLAAVIVPRFEVEGFWTALGAAIVISVVAFLGNLLFGSSSVHMSSERHGGPGERHGFGGRYSRIPFRPPNQRRHRRDDDDIIDV